MGGPGSDADESSGPFGVLGVEPGSLVSILTYLEEFAKRQTSKAQEVPFALLALDPVPLQSVGSLDVFLSSQQHSPRRKVQRKPTMKPRKPGLPSLE